MRNQAEFINCAIDFIQSESNRLRQQSIRIYHIFVVQVQIYLLDLYKLQKGKDMEESNQQKGVTHQATQQQQPSHSHPVTQQQQQPTEQHLTNAQMQQMTGHQQQAPQLVPNALFQSQRAQMQTNTSINSNNLNIVPPHQQRAPLGVYGHTRGQPMQPQQPALFNDDEPYAQNAKSIGTEQQGKIDISLLAQRSQVKMGEITVLPAMCKLASSGGNRTSVDLICVIDKSGSMMGEKIALVKETMKVLIETLTPSDRLSIITFDSDARRLCPLKAVTQENIVTLNDQVSQIYSSGGTSIMSGMNLALKTIRDRKIANSVTSIFLLSDGQDEGAALKLKNALNLQQNRDLGVFTIHSFGFGTDHDEDLMSKICHLKDGAFYFIKELSTLDEAFCNALGGIISLVANQINVNVRCIASGIVEGIKISKVFGKKWEKINDNQYRIKFTQMMSQITKGFVFQLTIPAIQGEVGDIGRQNVVLEGIMNAKGIKNQEMTGSCSLSLTLINKHQEIAEINENIQVIENYLTEKATLAIEENLKKAEFQQYQEARKGIDTMIHTIVSNKKARKEKMTRLLEDLQKIKEKCSPQDFHYEGRKWMSTAICSHGTRVGLQYQNYVQSSLVEKIKSSKRSD